MSFGSFDKPEQKFILIDKEGSYYFWVWSYKRATKYKGHLALGESLCPDIIVAKIWISFERMRDIECSLYSK